MDGQKQDIIASITRAKAELDQALHTLERLPTFETGTLAYTAHALSNYLTIADGTIDLLARHLLNDVDPEVRTWLDGLQVLTGRMAYTVAHLMNTATPGEPGLRLEAVDLVPLARRVCDYYRRIAAPKQLVIEFESSAESAFAWTDRVAIAAVLDNLLSNAVKFSPLGRHIWVRVHQEPARVACSVQDQGPGISPEDQAKLFQRGGRLSATPTGGEPSSGYGLVVAKDLIDRLGGEIRCDSQIGAGARFSIRVPTQPQSATSS
jgi:two-component system, sensor histidine kinase LadS